MIGRLLYLLAQYRHAAPKRSKSSRPRVASALPVFAWRFPYGTRVLSIGPRHVDELDALGEHGWQVTGVDLFPTHPRIERGDMEALPYAPATFDLVYAAHVLEHAFDLLRAAAEIARVVRPGGHVWLAVPRGCPPNRHDRHRFDVLDDVIAPFRGAEAFPALIDGQAWERELRVLLRLHDATEYQRRTP